MGDPVATSSPPPDTPGKNINDYHYIFSYNSKEKQFVACDKTFFPFFIL